MLVTDSEVLAYLRHREGLCEFRPTGETVSKALELNRPAPDFHATFGNSDISAYVGFIDLAGFSDSVLGLTPQEIAAYVLPFLQGVVSILRERGALVDKTIGDEVMFVLPTKEEDPYSPEPIFMGQILGALHDFAYEGDHAYRYRFGLSYGKMRAVRIATEHYEEWSFFGEPIHIAKRLCSIRDLSTPSPVKGAFGLKAAGPEQDEDSQELEVHLSRLGGIASRFKRHGEVVQQFLKGVGEVSYGVLNPRGFESIPIKTESGFRHRTPQEIHEAEPNEYCRRKSGIMDANASQ